MSPFRHSKGLFMSRWVNFRAGRDQFTPMRSLLRIGRGSPNPEMGYVTMAWAMSNIHKQSFGSLLLLEAF